MISRFWDWFRHDLGWMFVAIGALVLALAGVLVYALVTDEGCPEGTQSVVTGWMPTTTMSGKVVITNNIPITECR